MPDEPLSRRDFLKLALAGVGGLPASCLPQSKPDPTPTPAPSSTAVPPTNTPPPTVTPSPTATATVTSTPGATPTEALLCFSLLQPSDGASLPALGKVTFEWQPQSGAAAYRLLITLPGGATVPFDTDAMTLTLYLESFSQGGQYTWQVLALDAVGSTLCAASPFTFTKPAYAPSQTENPQGDKEEGEDDGSSDDWDDDGGSIDG